MVLAVVVSLCHNCYWNFHPLCQLLLNIFVPYFLSCSYWVSVDFYHCFFHTGPSSSSKIKSNNQYLVKSWTEIKNKTCTVAIVSATPFTIICWKDWVTSVLILVFIRLRFFHVFLIRVIHRLWLSLISIKNRTVPNFTNYKNIPS